MNRVALRVALCCLFLTTALSLHAASFTSTQNGNWSSASTWGGAGVPGSGDSATVNHTVTLDITVSVATLTLNGTVTGTNNLTVTTAFNWNNGTLSGSGSTSLPSGCVTTLAGFGVLDGRPMTIGGTFNESSSYYFYMQNNAVLTNNGTFDIQGDGGIYLNSAVGTTAINNNGTIQKSGGTGTANFTVPLNANSGSTFSQQSGTFNVAKVTATNASFNVSSGATLAFNTSDTRTFDASSSIAGLGTVNWAAGTNTVSGTYNITGATINSGATTTISPTSTGALTSTFGTLTLNSASTLTVPTLTISGGTLNGTAPLTVSSSPMNWSGGTLGGSGLITIPSGKVVNSTNVILDGRPLTNAGTIDLPSGSMSVGNNAVITNNGTIEFTGDGNIVQSGPVGTTAIVNNGTITKSSGASGSVLNVPLTMSSGSQMNVQASILYVGQITATSATTNVFSGATLLFYYADTRTYDASSSIGGSGTVQFASGTVTVNGPYNITGTTNQSGSTTTLNNITSTGNVTVSGGTLTLNSASTITVPTLSISFGTLAGTAPITVSNSAMTWSGGTISGSGLLTIPNTTTITLGSLVLDGRSVTNAGTINMVSNGTWYVGNNAVVTNNGAINLQGDSSINQNGAIGTTSFINNGSITKSSGTGGSTFTVPLTMTSGSQMNVQAAILYVAAVTSTGATFSVTTGATLWFYYSDTRTFDATSSISGGGSVNWGSGTNTVNAPYAINGGTTTSGATTTLNNISSTGPLTISGGTLTLNSASTLSVPSLTMSFGTLNGTAPISVTNSSMSWSGGTIGGTGLLTIPNGTTVTLTNLTLDGRPLTNGGVINMISNGTWSVGNNATVINNGTVDLQGDSSVSMNGAVGTTSFTNNGTIKKTSGSSGSSFTVPLFAQSGSFFLVQNGPAYLGPITSTGATFNAASTTTLYLYYFETRTFDAASTISGAGTVSWSNGTNTVNAVYNVTGTTASTGGTATLNNITSVGNLAISGGVLTLNSATPLSVGTLAMSGGTLNGTASINLTGTSMSWTTGTLGGSSSVTIPNGTTVTITSPTLDGRQLVNGGTINMISNGSLTMANNAVLTNNNLVDLQGDSNILLSGPTGSISFTNNGTLKKSNTVGSGSGMNVPLLAQSGSQLLLQSGLFYLGSITSTNASFNLSGGCTLLLYYGGTSTFDSASTISGAGTFKVQSGTTTFNGTITSLLELNSGTFTLNSASSQSVPTLTMTGGTLTGTGNLTMTGASATWTSGTLTGSGTFTISGSTAITVNGSFVLDGKAVTNSGTITFNATSFAYLQNNAVLTNNGLIDFPGDGSIYLNSIAGTTSVLNNATIRKSGGTGVTYFTVPQTASSGSQFLVQSGSIYVGNVAATAATFSISGGATLYTYSSDNRTFDAATSITGGGTFIQAAGTNTVGGTISTNLTIQSGTLTINSASPQSFPTIALTGGVLTGTANLNITGPSMTWTGGTLTGSGTLTIPNTTTITVNGAFTIDGKPVSNAGTINFSTTSYANLQNNGVLTNSGLIDFLADGSMYLQSIPGTTAVVNSGTIRKSSGANSYFTVPLTAQSGSQFIVQSGFVYLGSVTATSATFSIASGATLYTYTSDSRTFDAATSITGAGTYQSVSGSSTISGTISTNILMSGSTLTINSAATQSVPTLTMSGGTINGTGNINLTAASMNWSGGAIAGAGTLTIPNGTTINVTGFPVLDGRAVTNNGTIDITGTNYLYVQNNAVITNNNLIEIVSDGSLYLNSIAGTTAVINNATIRKSGGSSTSYFTGPLTAQSGSQFLVQSGTVYLGNVAATSAAFTIAGGATLYTYTNDNRTFDAATSITGAGTFQQGSGNNTINGTISTGINMTGATLTINSASAQSIPVLTMVGGTLNGTAALNVTGTAMTWSGGVIGGSGALTLAATNVISQNGYVYFDTRAVTLNGTLRYTAAVVTYLQNNAALTNNGTIDFQADAAIVLNIAPDTFTNNGTLKKTGGTSTSTITVATNNTGTIQPQTGTIAFSNGLTQSGTIYFTIAGATSFGKLNVSGNFALGGTLTANTTGGYTPPNGTTFHVLDFGSSNGAFVNKNLDYAGGTFVESYAPTSLILSAGPQALAITNVSPNRGTNGGGTSVAITGSDFVAGTSVTFGGIAAASVTYNNSTSLTAVTPAHATGTVDVVVTNPSTQTATLASGFTFTGLLAYYSFDVAGQPGNDVANGNNAAFVNNVTQVAGRIGQAGGFSSASMTLPSTTSFNLRSGGDFTLDAFVKSSVTTNGTWFAKPSYGLGTNNQTQALFSFDNGASGSTASASNVFDGNWHHLAAVHRGSQAEVWVDGQLESSSAVSGTTDSGAFTLGAAFDGLIDEAKIYNYALSTAEVRTDAQAADVAIAKSATPTVLVGQTITYSITVTNNGPVSATNVVVADTIPAATSFIAATPSQGSCSGAPNLTCNLGTIASGNNATITITANANSAGTITNTATVSANETDPVPANNTASASTTASTLSCPAPTITPSGPTTFCNGGSVTLTANATGVTSYQWYLNGNPIGGANAATYNATATGNYSVTVTYPTTCSASSAATTVTVNANPPTPVITPSGPTTFCNGGSVTLTAPAGYTYFWSNGANTQSINVTASGSYTVTVTDANGCSATSAATTVTVTNITPPTITPSGPTTFCGGGSVVLTAGAGYASYLWSTGAQTQSITVTASGNYSVNVTDVNGCAASSAPTTVTVTPAPAPVITGPGFTCNGAPVTLDAGSGYASYSWSTGATTQTITVTPSVGTTYSVTVTNGSGCSGSASKFVAVGSSVTPVISGPSAACPSTPITLDAGPGFTSYLWSTGATTQSITVTQSATTTYSVNVSNGGCNGSASKTVTMNAAPAVAITGPSTVCPNTPFTLDAGTGFAGYLWSNGATTSSITTTMAAGSANFTVTVTAGNGCTGTASQLVTVAAGANATITAPSTAQPNATGLTASVPAGPGGTTYSWSITHGTIAAGQGTPSITFSVGTTAATLSVTVTSGPCTNSGTKTVQITNTADLSVTLSATPDPVNAGSALTYTLAVVNHGPSSAANVVVNDTLPSGATFVSMSGSGWSCVSTQCSMSSLPFGSASPITLVVSAPSSAGTITDSASVTSATIDPKPSNDSASLTTVVNAPPQCPSVPPSLVSPANGATGVLSPVSLQWTGVSGATAYDVYTAIDGAPASIAGSTAATSLFVSLPSGAVSWFVVAHVPNCTDLTSPSGQFTISPNANCGAHGAPVLLSPAQNATVTSPVAFSWQPVPEAVGYRVSISVNGGADEDIGTTGGATTLTHDVPSGAITWIVDALFNGCPSTRSIRSAFTIPQSDPCAGHAAPSLVGPANNATATSSVDFAWTAVSGATGYRVWIAINGAPAEVAGETGGTTLHTTIASGAVDWFVEALFEGCASTSSTHSTFTIPQAQNCGTATATLVAPANNSSTTNASTTFLWNAAAGATSYELYLSLDSGSPVLIGTTGGTSLTKEVAPGVLKWFVRALFDGCPSRDSQPFTFTYAPPANCAGHMRPTLASPIDGSTLTSPVTFEWSDAGATSYHLLVNGEVVNPNQPLQLANGTYEWAVDALFNGCATLRSTSSHFTIVSKPAGCVVPDRPTLLAPSEVSAGVPYKVRWLPVLGADGYILQEANNAAFNAAQTFPATTDNKLTFSHPNPGTFFYRVRAIANCSTEPGAYSEVVGVTILPPNSNDAAASPDAPVTLTYSIPLDAALAGQSFTATPTEPWLTVTPSSGTIPAAGLTLLVQANTAGLPLGTSLGGVTITTTQSSQSLRLSSNGSTTSTTTLSVNVVQPVSPTSKSSPPPDALIIPAVAHADGFNSHFQSDVRLTNTSPQPMKYQLTFTPSGEDGLANGKQAQVDVDPGRTVALDDVLKSWFSSGSSDGQSGTLEVRPLTTTSSKVTSNAITGLANLVTFASSRTFNNTGNGTFGQYIPAIPFANFIGKSAGTITLQQIAQSAKYRTNLGLVEGSGQPASLNIAIFGSNGVKIKDFNVDLKGGQHTQLNSFLTTKGLELEDARVEVKVASGSGKVTAYASVLDNETQDPLLVTPTLLNGTGSTKYVLPGVADVAAWHSDVRIFNASSSKVDAQLTFVSQTGTKQTQSLSFAPNEVKELDNLLQSTFGVTNDGGALHIATTSPSNLIATARTYNLTTNGTYGQFISAVTPNDAAAAGTRPLQLLQVEESDRYRTNIGLAEVTGQPAKVEVTVIPPDSKVSAVVQLDLAPNEFRQLNQVLKSVGMDNTYNARVSVQVIDGAGKVTAYASVIDEETGDPTLIQAQ